MTTKTLFSRSAFKGAVAAIVVAAGAAGATFAVAQQDAATGVAVGGVTYTEADLDSVAELKAALMKATNKADVVKLLNLAAEAGLTKDSVLLAIQQAKAETTGTTNTVLASVETAVSGSTVSDSAKLTFYEGSAPSGTATGATGGAGNSALNGGVTQTANNDGTVGTGPNSPITTTVVYVG